MNKLNFIDLGVCCLGVDVFVVCLINLSIGGWLGVFVMIYFFNKDVFF